MKEEMKKYSSVQAMLDDNSPEVANELESRQRKKAVIVKQRHWDNPFDNAVDIDLWELFRALWYYQNAQGAHTFRSFDGMVGHYAQQGTMLDAYILSQPYKGNPNALVDVGIRYSSTDSHYISPVLTRDIAEGFGLYHYSEKEEYLKFEDDSAEDKAILEASAAKITCLKLISDRLRDQHANKAQDSEWRWQFVFNKLKNDKEGEYYEHLQDISAAAMGGFIRNTSTIEERVLFEAKHPDNGIDAILSEVEVRDAGMKVRGVIYVNKEERWYSLRRYEDGCRSKNLLPGLISMEFGVDHQDMRMHMRRDLSQKPFEERYDTAVYEGENEVACSYVDNSNDPCATCPKLATALYMCKLLQEVGDDD